MELSGKRKLESTLLSSKKSRHNVENKILTASNFSKCLENKFLNSLSSQYDNLLTKHSSPSILTAFTANKLLMPSTENKVLIVNSQLPKSPSIMLESLQIVDESNEDFTEKQVQDDSENVGFFFNAPEYKFEHIDVSEVVPPERTFSATIDKTLTESVKYQFVMEVASSLIKAPNFQKKDDSTRQNLIDSATAIAKIDPEFILKVALYARCHLYIRSTANFLLAFSANNALCRPYLKKYFKATVRLPTDWLAVTTLLQGFKDPENKDINLPAVLRKCLVGKFPDFDLYQLGKYNRSKTKKSRLKKKTLRKEILTNIKEKTKALSLKYLVKRLHITEPVDHVMKLLGKRYPKDLQTFYKSRLPGLWDPEKAGLRMKVPVPETWETALSLKGNHKQVWETLIDNNKLPFMAMLRNIANLLRAGISKKHHQWVLNKLTNEKAVIESKQLPIRFLSASQIIDDLHKNFFVATEVIKNKSNKVLWWVMKRNKINYAKSKNYTVEDLKKYSTALNTAMKIAANHNLEPIRGRSLIFCYINQNANQTETKLQKESLLISMFGLMCAWASETCSIYGFTLDHVIEVQLPENFGLESIICIAKSYKSSGQGCIQLKEFLMDIFRKRIQFDNFIIITEEHAYSTPQVITDFIPIYRHFINKDLLYVNLNVKDSPSCQMLDRNPKNLTIAGQSDQLLRFISECGNSSQMNYIENIDSAYNLKSLPQLLKKEDEVKHQNAVSQILPVPVWRTVRVFISSTFQDMHGERDLLVRYVFPELRERAKKRLINVYEVDLRWGVTEQETLNNRTLEICLCEVSKCQLFVSILGERYGTILEDYHISDKPEFDWLRDYPPGASVTELEIYSAALCKPHDAKGRAFFYFRNNNFEKNIPEKWKSNFVSESSSAHSKLSALKNNIKSSGLEVFDNYPCEWGGILLDTPVITGLDIFGQRVLNNLWNSVVNMYPDSALLVDEVSYETSVQNSSLEQYKENFVGRRSLIKRILDHLHSKNKPSLLLLYGRQGSGKTTLMAHLPYACLENTITSHSDKIIVHFVGVTLNSSNIDTMLKRIITQLQKIFNLEEEIPTNYLDLCKMFPHKLKLIAQLADSQVLIFIDGLDLLRDQFHPQNLNWLPEKIPEKVTFVVSALEGGIFHQSLTKRELIPIQVGSLDNLEKAEVIRTILAKHRKTLNESAFNNQMKLLLLKREAHIPLFLYLACEELRLFRVFEKLNDKLKSLGHTVENLILQIIHRLEASLEKKLISTVLCSLYFSRLGLSETSLHTILNLDQNIPLLCVSVSDIINTEVNKKIQISSLVFLQMLHSLKILLKIHEQDAWSTIQLSHGEVAVVIQNYYVKKMNKEEIYRLHRLIAGHFWLLADPDKNGSWQGKNLQAFSELCYHLCKGCCYQELKDILCNLSFIQAKYYLGLGQQLFEDYHIMQMKSSGSFDKDWKELETSCIFQEYKSFVFQNSHILNEYPFLTLQLAINNPDKTQPSCDAKHLLKKRRGYPIIEWKNKKQNNESCFMTINNIEEVVTALAVSNQNVLACGLKDGRIYLYNIRTFKEILSFMGHASSITSLCYVGNNKLCSASKDNTLSVWDIVSGHRLFILNEHSRQVSSCCSDPDGQFIISVGWDCYLKVWDANNGRCLYSVKPEIKPINCIAMHPEIHEIVTVGTWSGKLYIWNLYSRTQIKVLNAHRASIRDVVYSHSSKYLASVCLEGLIKLWEMTSGTLVGLLSGHSLPVNCMVFCSKDDSLVTVSDDNSVKIWSSTVGKCVKVVPSENGLPSCLDISVDKKSIAIGYCGNGIVELIDVDSGMRISKKVLAVSDVTCIKYFLHLPFVIVGLNNSEVKILSSCLTLVADLKGHTKRILSITGLKGCYSNLICSTSEDGTCCIFSVDCDRLNTTSIQTISPIVCLTDHHAPVTCCCVSQQGHYLFTGGQDRTILVWLVRELEDKSQIPKPVKEIPFCHPDWITCCDLLDSPTILVTGSNDFNLKIWNWKTEIDICVLSGHQSPVTCVQCVPGLVVSADLDGLIKIWNKDGVEITTLKSHTGRINDLKIIVPEIEWKNNSNGINNDEDHYEEKEELESQNFNIEDIVIVSCSNDQTIRFWKPFWVNEKSTLTGHSESVIAVTTSPDGNIITSSLDKTVKFWHLSHEDTKESQSSPHSSSVTAISSNKIFVITASRCGDVIIWRKTQSRWIHCMKFSVHNFAVTAVTFLNSSDIEFATASEDCSIAIWKSPSLELPLVKNELSRSDDVYTSMDCSKDFKYLAAGLMNGNVEIFDVKNFKNVLTIPNYVMVCNVKFCSKTTSKLAVGLSDGEIIIMQLKLQKNNDMSLEETKNSTTLDIFSKASKIEQPFADDIPSNFPDVWPECVEFFGNEADYSYIGLSLGQILIFEENFARPSFQQIHHSTVIGCCQKEGILFTASHDQTIKAWKCKNGILKQIALFPTTTRICCLHVTNNDDIIAGDILGNIYFLKYH